MATFHENLVQSFKNFKDKYLKANGVTFQFSYDSSTGKFGYKDANGNFVPFKKVQASKTVSPSTSSQTVTPDSGYDGIASVTVNAVNLQSKTVSPSTSSQTVTPDSGCDGMSSVTVNAVNLQSKTVYPSTSSQTVTPDSGYDGMSSVKVNAISASSISPSSSGTYFSSGLKNMTSSGYAYSSRPSGLSETTLWTNSSPTSSFAGNITVTWSGHNLSDFTYIKIKVRHSTTNASEITNMMSVNDFKNTAYPTDHFRMPLGLYNTSNAGQRYRTCAYDSETSIKFSNGTANSATNSSVMIPLTISGLK